MLILLYLILTYVIKKLKME